MSIGADDTEDGRVVDVEHLGYLPLVLVVNHVLVDDLHLLVWVQENDFSIVIVDISVE